MRTTVMAALAAGLATLPVGAAADDVAPADDAACITLFDFDETDALAAWDTTNDNVMGGKSSGGPAVTDGTLIFSGVTNTDGGGFSSIKAEVEDRDLSGVTAFRIRYRGDGRSYLFSTETGETRWIFMRIQYWTGFDTSSGAGWQEVSLPVTDLNAHFHGEPIKERTFDPARVKDLGFFIYDKQDGPFELQVDWIKACR